MMYKVFKTKIGENMKVYVDDMIVKLSKEKLHDQPVTRFFWIVRQNNMRFNPGKCTSGVRANKFMGFYVDI